MLNIIGKRNWYFVISALIIIPGLVAMGISFARWGTPVRLSIDFRSGSLLELDFEQPVAPLAVRSIAESTGIKVQSVQSVGSGNAVVIRYDSLEQEDKARIEDALAAKFGTPIVNRSATVGPAVSQEVTQAALLAVAAASALIIGYIWIAFRKVPNSLRYGVCAIAAMLHDILVTLGLFSIMGLVLGWEADALFVTALLTVIGFSVQDTIVVYDRIRENSPKLRGQPYETIVNRSLLETLHRSLATQLNAMFVLLALMIFGGANIFQFVAVLFVGMISGSYSSIFNAVPLLVVWENGDIGRLFGRARRQPAA